MSDVEDETEHEDLPRGSGRELIEYYFKRGLTYRCITLMLGKHHGIDMTERTLKRRLKDYGLRRRDAVNDDLVQRVRDLTLLEICTGPDRLVTEPCGMCYASDITFMFPDGWLNHF